MISLKIGRELCPYIKEYTIITGAELTKLDEASKWYGPISSGFFDYSLDEGKVREVAKANPEATFVFKTGSGPDGDYEFMTDEDDYDLDYDIDLDRFDDEDIELFESSEDTKWHRSY